MMMMVVSLSKKPINCGTFDAGNLRIKGIMRIIMTVSETAIVTA